MTAGLDEPAESTALTDFQIEVARVFFALAAADRFLLDSPAMEPATASFIGPTYAPVELAARKLLALFDRAAARDFVDVFALMRNFPREELIKRAQLLDAGFDTGILGEQLDTLRRFRDEDLPIDANEVLELRSYFEDWTADIRCSA